MNKLPIATGGDRSAIRHRKRAADPADFKPADRAEPRSMTPSSGSRRERVRHGANPRAGYTQKQEPGRRSGGTRTIARGLTQPDRPTLDGRPRLRIDSSSTG